MLEEATHWIHSYILPKSISQTNYCNALNANYVIHHHNHICKVSTSVSTFFILLIELIEHLVTFSIIRVIQLT